MGVARIISLSDWVNFSDLLSAKERRRVSQMGVQALSLEGLEKPRRDRYGDETPVLSIEKVTQLGLNMSLSADPTSRLWVCKARRGYSCIKLTTSHTLCT